MNIIEVTKKVKETGSAIKRASWDHISLKLDVDGLDIYEIVDDRRNSRLPNFWNPKLKDILADDWEVV